MVNEPDRMHVSGDLLLVDTSHISSEETITVPMWRWHVLTCHSTRLAALIEQSQHDVRPISGGHPAAAVDAVYEFIVNEVGWDAGEAMRLQASDLLDALRAAGFGLVQLHQPNTTHHPWCNRLRGHVGPCQTGQTADQLDVSAVSGDEAGDG